MTPSCPNWLRVVLLGLEITVFLPQIWRIWTQKTNTGLSLLYIFLNLLTTTERFTAGLLTAVNWTIAGADPPGFFAHTPRTTGDTLNLVQLGIDWVLLLLLFILCLTYPPPYSPYARLTRIFLAVLYTAFTFISIIPTLADALFTIFHEPGEREPDFGVAIFMGFHIYFLSTLGTLLVICAFIPQAIRLRSLPANSGVVRVRDWTLQAVVLAMIAVSWIFRVKLPSGEDDVLMPFRSIPWFVRIGWPAGGTGIFAVVQGGLAVLGMMGRKGVVGGGSGGQAETDPLLGGTRDGVEEHA
ncbi:hypothetical protein AbraIFM66951_008084 [Aspergillus brasiliensis]|uniref:Uncharacterized protein n=1 Tax=Aspergillus brasiliensis TaxID=319629 RepID=A0A9W6DTP6_9EURO|nr:hypothetical protein AbraCBS73388_003735 [Aspergillus brasiliensis]GKZ45446.1 hypothetical protein AbraIFM66951_008084 [Aspergillus brasiliensis]